MDLSINPNIFLYLLIAVGVAAVGGLVFLIVKSFKQKKKTRLLLMLISCLCISVSAASVIFNIGWLRMAMLFLLLPIVHAIALFALNIYSSNFLKENPKIRQKNIIFNVSYLFFYILFPDGGDTGNLYCFFGLVKNNIIAYICAFLSFIAISLHIISAIQQIDIIQKTKKNTPKKI